MSNADAADRRLIALSAAAAADPIAWPERVERDGLFFAPELISLAGTDALAGLDEAGLRRLTLFEAASFFSLNIHGEAHLVAGLTARLDCDGFADHAAYLRHFIAEERRHSAWFATFCTRYAGRTYPDRMLAVAAGEGIDADLLFLARIVLFEEIVDRLNRAMARDRRLHPVARAINAAHHADEARHLAFGHRLLGQMVAARRAAWSEDRRAGVARGLERFVEQVWRALFNPAAYADAGLADPYGLRRQALASEAAAGRRTWALKGCRRLLARLDLAGDPT